MSALSNKLALREEMQHEENVRLNRAHALLLKRAPEVWGQFKAAFSAECDEINSQINLTQVRYDEPNPHALCILRERRYVPEIIVQSFQFDPKVPCISWQDLLNNKPSRVIEMILDGPRALFVLDGKSIVLAQFVASCLENIS
jgi:hypothetical protein